MKFQSFLIRTALIFCALSVFSGAVFAEFNLATLNPGTPGYADDVEAINRAIAFSILEPESRTKIPGPGSPYLETGYSFNTVDNKRISPYTDSLHSPSEFQSIYGLLGIGLPFGMVASIGFSQIMSEHKFNGVSASVMMQVLDLSNFIYTDLVPTLTIGGTLARTLSEPSCNVFSAQANLGAFHRVWGMQFAYIFQTVYSTLGALTTSNSSLFLRHGALMALPLWEGFSLRTQILLPDLNASIGANYQF